MRIVENALSISAAFLSFSFSLFFSLPPELRGLNLIFLCSLAIFTMEILLTTSLRHQFFYFLSDVASSPLVYFKEMRFPSCSFSISSAHTQQTIKKSVFRLGRPEIGFRNFVSSPSLPLSFIRLPPRTEAPKILSLTNE